MATIQESHLYRCWDDCRFEGCPGHTVTFTYQNTADVFRMRVDDHEPHYIDLNVLPLLVDFLKGLDLV